MSCIASGGVVFCQFTAVGWILGVTAVAMFGAAVHAAIGRLLTR